MPAERIPKRPSAATWADARLKWESDPRENWESIARWIATQGPAVTRVAVSKRADKEGWARPQNLRDIAQSAHLRADAREVAAKVSLEAAKVAAETRAQAVAEVAIDVRADVLERHRQDWNRHRELFTLDAIHDQFEVGKSAKISAEMLTLRQRGERAAYGIEDAPQANPLESMTDEELQAEKERLSKA